MSLGDRMNDFTYRVKKAIQNKTYEEYKGQSQGQSDSTQGQSQGQSGK